MHGQLVIGACELAAFFTVLSVADGWDRWKQGMTKRNLRRLAVTFCLWFVIGLPVNLIRFAWPTGWDGTSQWWRMSGVYVSGTSLALCSILIAFGLLRQRTKGRLSS